MSYQIFLAQKRHQSCHLINWVMNYGLVNTQLQLMTYCYWVIRVSYVNNVTY